MGLTRADYARARGCDESAVRRAIRDGRISVLDDGTIDPDRADAEWAANTRGRATPTRAPEGPVEVPDYAIARARREQAQAELAELKLAEERGALVRREAVRRMAFAVAREVRNRLLSTPQRLAPTLVGKSQLDIQQAIAAELHDILEAMVPEGLR